MRDWFFIDCPVYGVSRYLPGSDDVVRNGTYSKLIQGTRLVYTSTLRIKCTLAINPQWLEHGDGQRVDSVSTLLSSLQSYCLSALLVSRTSAVCMYLLNSRYGGSASNSRLRQIRRYSLNSKGRPRHSDFSDASRLASAKWFLLTFRQGKSPWNSPTNT